MKDREKENNNENVMLNYKMLTGEQRTKNIMAYCTWKFRKLDSIVRDVQWKFYIQRMQSDYNGK